MMKRKKKERRKKNQVKKNWMHQKMYVKEKKKNVNIRILSVYYNQGFYIHTHTHAHTCKQRRAYIKKNFFNRHFESELIFFSPFPDFSYVYTYTYIYYDWL